MAQIPTCNWIGASRKTYTYFVHDRHPNVAEGNIGNYIYAKLNSSGLWVPVYIGEGDLSVRTTGSHHRVECIDAKKATHIHMHINSIEKVRLAEEADLLANYPNAYDPNGCNVKIGG